MRLRAKRRERIKGGGQRMMISSSRTSHRVSTKACTDVSLFCISNKTVVRVFWGANRKDVINLTTTTTKKRTKRHIVLVFCLLPCKERLSQSHTHEKKESRKIERRIFLLSRITGRDFASSSAFKREKEIFLQPPHDETKKLDSSDLSLSHIIISSLIASLAFSVVVTQNAPLS